MTSLKAITDPPVILHLGISFGDQTMVIYFFFIHFYFQKSLIYLQQLLLYSRESQTQTNPTLLAIQMFFPHILWQPKDSKS